MIYLPGSGILTAYTDPATGELNAQFPNALAMYLWAWFILTVIFNAAMRSSWVLFLDLFFLDLVLLLLACGYMLNEARLETAGSALGYVVAILSSGLVVLAYLQTELPPSTFQFFRCTKGNDCKT